jgi:hypothetical protein
MITNQVHALILKSNGQNCYIPFQAELKWDPAEPLAVHMVCHLDDGDRDWMIGRDLLAEGAVSLKSVGDGDVRIKREGPVSSRLLVCLRSHDGHADLGLNQPHVIRFLGRIQTACPLGQEDITDQIDELIKEIYSA